MATKFYIVLPVSSTIPYHFLEIWEGFSTEIRFTQGVEAPETARVRGPVPPMAGPSSQGVKLMDRNGGVP